MKEDKTHVEENSQDSEDSLQDSNKKRKKRLMQPYAHDPISHHETLAQP